MEYRKYRNNEEPRGSPAIDKALLSIGCVSAALAVTLSALTLAPGMAANLVGSAPLASAWLNVFIVATVASLARRMSNRSNNRVDWRVLFATAVRHAIRREPEGSPEHNLWRLIVNGIDWRPWIVTVGGCVSVVIALTAWHAPSQATVTDAMKSPGVSIAAGTIALALAFVTLVAERHFAATAVDSSAAASLTRMLRAVLLTTLTVAAAVAWLARKQGMPDWLIRVTALFNAVVAAELAIRGLMSWFVVRGGGDVPSSTIAGLLRVRLASWALIGDGLRVRYGIDLRQNWALSNFLRLLPLAVSVTLASAWLLSAAVVLGPDQRAVYERFGAPVAVWQPGLHVGLPWPFGHAYVVENGTVHQVIVSGNSRPEGGDAAATPADGPVVAALDRLWDAPHPGETTQVIAGANGSRQNFQIVNADVRVDYRVGPSDADAVAALYRAVDPGGIVRVTANREVVHYLASHTLESLLETSQSAMADSMRRVIQAQLDRVGSGIDVVAVVIESVHPPTGASAAYHNVQAAQIRAQGRIAQARRFAVSLIGETQQHVLSDIAQAEAQAGDTVSAACVQLTNFEADRVALQLGGPAFLFEYYLNGLQRGLRNPRMTIIDGRLVDGTRATVDLRTYPAGDLAGIR